MKQTRRITYRRGSDTKWQVWWPVGLQMAATVLAVVGLYYGLMQKQAVQAALFEERTLNLKDQIGTLQRNVEGLERYVIDLYRQEHKETK